MFRLTVNLGLGYWVVAWHMCDTLEGTLLMNLGLEACMGFSPRLYCPSTRSDRGFWARLTGNGWPARQNYHR